MVSQPAESSRPSRSAVSNRAPTKLLAGIPARRTTEEVRLEREAAAIAAEKVKANAHAEKLAIQQKFGTIEDQVRREDIHRQKIAARPDLHDMPVHQTVKPKRKRVPGAGEDDEPPKLKFILKPSLTLMGAGKTKPTTARTVAAAGLKSSSESEPEDGTPATADDDNNTSSAATPCPDSSDEAPVLETGSVPDSENTGNPILDEEDEYDREDDPDYELDEGDGEGDKIGLDDFDDDSDGKVPTRPRHQQKKASTKTKSDKALEFRAEVGAFRETTARSAISGAVSNNLLKRKKVEEVVIAGKGSGSSKDKSKRPRREEPSGLLKNFRPTINKSTSSRAQTEHSTDGDGELDEYNGGLFDEDEDEHSLELARTSKSKALVRGSKPGTSVRVIEPPAPSLALAVSRRRFKKDQCKKSNLPFPGHNANRCRDLWDKNFKSTVIAWNGSLRQPFSSSTLLSSEVRVIWGKVFKDLAPLDDDDDRWDIVEAVTADFLLNWRSEIGKTAIMVTVSFLRRELDVPAATEVDEIHRRGVEAATYLLDDLRFVYGDPDADSEAGESAQPLQSTLVLETFTYHIRQSVYRINEYKISKETGKHSVGALGLCAAAVERALTLIRDGHITIEKWPPALLPSVADATVNQPGMKGSGKRRKAPYTSFSEAGWGEETRGYVETAEGLPRDQWEAIAEKATTEEIEAILDAIDNSGGGSAADIRAKQNARARLRK
ncbi:hypothetical protein MD484_g6518, partial [Candolleomyces efflorescens]